MSDGFSGRAIKLKIGMTVIAGLQSKTLTNAREAVDTTNDDNNGWRSLLPVPGIRSIDAKVEGVCTEDNLSVLQGLYAGVVNAALNIEYPDGSTATAADGFFFSAFEISGTHDKHVAFSATFMSSGVVTFVAAP